MQIDKCMSQMLSITKYVDINSVSIMINMNYLVTQPSQSKHLNKVLKKLSNSILTQIRCLKLINNF